jgi:acyl-CoA thioester hydrolase
MSFSHSTRVYYEDTDAGGVVYYANYLKYLERCRTEWLRAAGFDQSALLAEHGLAFMVRRVEADYRRPAVLDDVLHVSLRIEKFGGARIVFAQVVSRQGRGGPESLVEARVEIACVNMKTGKPMPIPEWMRERLTGAR